MKTATKVALACAAVAVVVGTGVASYLVSTPASSPSASSPETAKTAKTATRVTGRMVTLTLNATGDADTQITYTCADAAGSVDMCGPESVPVLDVWTKTVTVPAGTTVRVQAHGGTLQSWCSISDESGQLVLDRNHETGECATVAK